MIPDATPFVGLWRGASAWWAWADGGLWACGATADKAFARLCEDNPGRRFVRVEAAR